MISATRTNYKTVRLFSVGYVHAPTSPSVLQKLCRVCLHEMYMV